MSRRCTTRWSAASCTAPVSTCLPRNRRTPNNPLLKLDQVVVTPHIAGSAIDLVADIARHAFTNMQSVLNGDPLPASDVIVAAGDNR